MNIGIFLATLLVLLPSSYQLPPLALPIGSFYLMLFEIIVFGIVFLWCMRVLFSGRLRHEKSLYSSYVFLLLCLYAVYIVAGLFERDVKAVLGDFRQYMPLALYFPLLRSLYHQKDIESFRRSLFVSLIVVSAYIIVLMVFFNGRLMAYAARGNTGFTGERIFIDNSVFLFFCYLGFFVARLFAEHLGVARRMFYFVVIFLSILSLVIMQVRSFWMITLIILILSSFSLKGFVHKFKYASITAVAILFTVLPAFLMLEATEYRSKALDSLKDRLASFSDLDKVGQKASRKKPDSIGSLDTRLATAKYVMEKTMESYWLFGLGFGGQIPMVNYLGSATMKYQIDNGYLTLLAKFGIFGLMFYTLFTLKIITSLFRIIFNPMATEEDVLLSKSFLYAIGAMAAGSFFTSIFIREQVCIVSFVIMLCEIEGINYRLLNRKAAKDEAMDAWGLQKELSTQY